MLFRSEDGSFEYTPDADFRGYDSFVYEVQEPDSDLTDEGTVTILVNDKPTAYDASLETPEETPIDIDLEDHADWIPYMPEEDSEDPTTWTIVAQPEHGTLAGTAPELTYTPDLNYVGEDEFTFIVNDGLSDSNEGTITITMTPVNDPSEAEDDAYETPEDTELVVTAEDGVMANDSDPDDDPLVVSLVTDVAYGTLDLNADGSFTYMPDADFNGEDSFVYELYSLADGTTDPFYSDQATVIITVTPVNDAPVAEDVSETTEEDTPVDVTLVASDVDDDTLTYAIVDEPAHGSVILVGDVATYTPELDFTGEDSFTFKANDGLADSNVATVTITVTPVNDAPVAVDDEYTVAEKETLTISVPGVLGNDSDVEGDTLTAILVDTVQNGTLTLNADGSFIYTPNEYFNGTDSFTYKASDGELESELAVVTITVTPVNDWVEANDDAYETIAGVTLDVAAPGVLENDVLLDPDEEVSIQILEEPQHGALSMNDDGSFTYTPNPGYMGTDTFRYMVLSVQTINAAEWSDDATVTITVQPLMRLFLPLILR